MKKYILSLVVMLTLVSCWTARSRRAYLASDFKIESVYFFDDFRNAGGTTAGISSHFLELKDNCVDSLTISKEGITQLEGTMNRAKKLKHWQRKFGGNKTFAMLKKEGTNGFGNRMVFVTGISHCTIVNLSRMIEYRISQAEDVKWLNQLRNRLEERSNNNLQ